MMNSRDETSTNELPENGENEFDYNERLHELQLINEILIEIYRVEDPDKLCKLAGEAVHKLNKDCYVIVAFYDSSINSIRVRAAIGFENFAEKVVGMPGRDLANVTFMPEYLELNSQLLTSGKLENFKDGLYILLAKKIPQELCKKIEINLNIDSIQVIGFSHENNIFGSISILVPKDKKKLIMFFSIETIASHVSEKIHNIRTEKALIEAENRFELLFQQAPLSYHSLDEKGYFIDVNNTWLETLGYSWKEVIGKCFEDFLTPRYAEKFKAHLEKFKLQGEVQGVEYEAVRKDGKVINIVLDGRIAYDENGSFKQTHCVFKDITAQKEAERKALENEKLLRSMMDAITESVILMKPDRAVAYINETAAKRLNITQDEFIGKKLDTITPEDILDQRIKMFNIVLTEEKSVKFEDVRNGIHFLHHIYPVYNSSSQFSHFAVFSMDISEYRKAEKKLKWELAVNRELAELADALLDPNNSIETIAGIVLSASLRLTDSEHGYVSSIDPETGDNICYSLTRMMKTCNTHEKDKKVTFSKDTKGLYPKLLGYALNTKRGFYTNSPKTHPASGGVPEGHIPLENFLSVPAIVGNELVGQVSLANSKKSIF
ncbi:PAS domain S-box protein [Methanosarcina horonobensis]|uniref:PAS domain S-box protein n=1 Tax=Methanosarcina horonobensis TaxID=418008 RepID=UPI000AC3768C|nr:PAS domain S-box protein [Methanosarcina horonobensis]